MTLPFLKIFSIYKNFWNLPELLTSGAWAKILSNLEDHFGEGVDIDVEFKKIITKYLNDNAAEHSNTKLAIKIIKCLRGRIPSRVTDIPYIRRKHYKIAPEIFSRKAVGSLSNCSACHRTAGDGIYDDDYVAIPK